MTSNAHLFQMLPRDVVQLHGPGDCRHLLLRLRAAVDDHQALRADGAHRVDEVRGREAPGAPEAHRDVRRQLQQARVARRVDPLVLLLCDVEALGLRLVNETSRGAGGFATQAGIGLFTLFSIDVIDL